MSCQFWRIIFCLTMGSVLFGCSKFSRKSSVFKQIPIQPQLRLSSPITSTDADSTSLTSPLELNESRLTADDVTMMSLLDCIRQALTTARAMQDLGSRVLDAPNSVVSVYDPAISFTDPLTGEEAALSGFDAAFFAQSSFERNKRRVNNGFYGNNGLIEQYLSSTQVGITKRSATGGIYKLRSVTIGDHNNQISNSLGEQSWESFFEAEARQPVLRNSGTMFNRIAGLDSRPGQLNGVLLARTRTDISLVGFSIGVRNFVSEVENAYWDLYFAYRDLEAKMELRDISSKTLAAVENRKEQAADVAQAREQFLRFQSDVVQALNGRPIDGTRANNGTSAGTFQGKGGIRIAERRLRLLIGLPINDNRLIQPSDAPSEVPVQFDWNGALSEALVRREEIRRQKWVIKATELELLGNRNFLKPQLDLIGRYRYRGFGDKLYGSAETDSFFDGELQEWQLGLEYEIPIGLRLAHAAVRNSELGLARESAILERIQRNIEFGLSNAISELKRAYETRDLQRQRLDAIVDQLNALDNKTKANEKPELDVLLETHRRLLDARLQYHRANVEYALAIRNVHFEKGSLLKYNGVHLVESIPSEEAKLDARERIQFQSQQRLVTEHRDPVIAR